MDRIPSIKSAVLAVMFLVVPTADGFGQEFRYFPTSFSLTDLDIGKLVDRLSRIGIRIPFDLEGDATVNLQLEIPVNALNDGAAYRFDGSISSTRLRVQNLELLNVELEALYRDGVLNLDPLAFRIADLKPDGSPGQFQGSGRLELVPEGDLSLSLNLADAPATSLSGVVSQPPLLAGGQLSGDVTGTVAAGDVGDVTAWILKGEFSAADLLAQGRVLNSASFRFQAEDGEVQIPELAAQMDGAKLNGSATALLTGQTSYQSQLNLEVSEIAKLVPEAEGVRSKSAWKASARLSGQLAPFSVTADGDAALPETSIGRLTLNSAGLKFAITEEQFAINDLNAQLYGGAVTGGASLPRRGEDDASFNIELEKPLDLNALADGLSGTDLEIDGQITGQVKASTPRRQIADLTSWNADAGLSIENGQAFGLEIRQAGIALLLEEGVLSLSETALGIASVSGDLQGQVDLKQPQAFRASVKLRADDLKDLNRLSGEAKLPFPLAGRLRADGSVTGKLQDRTWAANGNLAMDELTVDKVQVDRLTAKASVTPESISLDTMELDVYEGKVTGKARYPLAPAGEGGLQVDWQGVNLGRLVPLYLNYQTPIVGIFSGQATASLGQTNASGERPLNAKVDFKLPEVTVGPVKAGDLSGRLQLEKQRLDYEVTGSVFDGDLKLKGALPTNATLAPGTDEKSNPGQGRIELDDLQLDRAVQALFPNFPANQLTGQANLGFEWSRGDDGEPAGSGTLSLIDLVWDGRQITDRLEGDLLIRGERILAKNLRGRFAGAQVLVEAVWGIGSDRTRLLNLRAIGLDSAAIASLLPLPKLLIDGRFDVEAAFQLRELWQFTARLRAAQLQLGGLKVQSVTLPIRGWAPLQFARGEMRVRGLGASLAGGRIQGQMSLGWGERRSVQGKLEFRKIDTKTLVRQLWGSNLPGDGALSGRIQLDNKKLDNWDDAAVEIDAELSRCRPRKLPIFSALESVARTVSLSQPIEEGHIKARYARGNVRLNELSLSGPSLELTAEGSIAANKRLNLNTVIKTGRRSLDRRIAHLVGGRLGDRVIGLLADRLLQARITGTINRPVVNVKPLSLVDIKVLR